VDGARDRDPEVLENRRHDVRVLGEAAKPPPRAAAARGVEEEGDPDALLVERPEIFPWTPCSPR